MTSTEPYRVVLEDLPVVDNKLRSREHGPTPKMPKAGVEKLRHISIMMIILRRGITMVQNHMIKPKRSSRRIITLIRVVKDTKPHGKIGPKLKHKPVINGNKRPNKRTNNNKSRAKEVAGSRPSVRIRQTRVQDFTIPEHLKEAANHNLIRVKIPNMGSKDQGLTGCLQRSLACLV